MSGFLTVGIVQTALEIGLIYSLIALSLFISYSILNICDLSTDGCYTLGSAVGAMVTIAGHPLLAIPAAMLSGVCSGFITALLQTRFGVESILAGIIVNTGLYTINLAVMGFSANVSIFGTETVFSLVKNLSENEVWQNWSRLILLSLIIIGICLVIAMPGLENPDLAFATATTSFTPVGIRGVIMAAAMAAVMSTASSEIMGTATVAYNDLISNYKENITEKQGIMITRIIAIIVGLLAIVCALWIQSVLVALDVAYAFISGCVFVPLVFAFLLKKVSAKAGLLSLLGSFVTVIVFMVKDGLAATTPIMFGMLVSAVIFFVVTAIDRNKHEVKILEDGSVIVDGVKQEMKKRKSAQV